MKPYPRNPRRITDKRQARLTDTLERLGDLGGIVHNLETDEIIGGNQRMAVFKDGQPVVVEAYDSTDEQGTVGHGFIVWRGKKYAYRQVRWEPETAAEANIAANIGAGDWDWEMLKQWDASELQSYGFEQDLLESWQADAEALGAMLAEEEQEGPGGDPGAALERAEALQEKYNVQRGQIWELGRHRLMCGDAYSAEDRKVILGDSSPSMLHIDPPYGINIVQPRNGDAAAAIGGSKPFGGTSGTQRKTGAAERSARAERGHVQHRKPSKNQLAQSNEYLVIKGDRPGMPTVPVGIPSENKIIQSNLYPVIQGDDRPFDPVAFLGLAPVTIMWGGNYFADKLPASSCWIVWDKREDITRNTFADCELAWSNLAKPARLFHHLWNGLHKGSQHGQRRTHPTEKPVALFEEIGRMFCPEGVWLDLFAGTGAQLIAAERLPDVRCFANEIEPIYVATILERWSVMTGQTPVLLNPAAPNHEAPDDDQQSHDDEER